MVPVMGLLRVEMPPCLRLVRERDGYGAAVAD